MSLFDADKPVLRFPNRGRQYRQDVDFICGCRHPACQHPIGECSADSIAGYFWLGKKKYAFCQACIDFLDSKFIELRKAFVGQMSPTERE